MMLCADEPARSDSESYLNSCDWETDYEAAVKKAQMEKRNLLIYFRADLDSPRLLNETEEKFVRHGSGTIRQVAHVSPSMRRPLPVAGVCREFEKRILTDGEVGDLLDGFVLLTLPMDAKTKGNEKKIRFLDDPAYREMQGCPGLAVLDFENEDQPYYGKLVGILPFLRAKMPGRTETQTFLTLPPGTLSQRTLIHAIRIHPERPRSTEGTPHPVVVKGAADHSVYQARVTTLGHQNFGSRSARITSTLGGGGASEICAQSWPNEGLYEAAIGCVRAWRSSSGHWSGAKKKHRYYGYDMVRGRDGIWYATGLFVD